MSAQEPEPPEPPDGGQESLTTDVENIKLIDAKPPDKTDGGLASERDGEAPGEPDNPDAGPSSTPGSDPDGSPPENVGSEPEVPPLTESTATAQDPTGVG